MRDEGDDAVIEIPTGATKGRCRACDAPMLWALTDAGKKMPLDPRPREDGNVAFVGRLGSIAVFGKAAKARMVEARARNGEDPIEWYVSHFATCPERAKPARAPGVDRCLVNDQSPSAGAVKGYTGFQGAPCRRPPTTTLADGTPACDQHAQRAERAGDDPDDVPDPNRFVDPGEL